jgi:hypothetical protein
MKVTHARTRLLSTPADNPLVVGLDQPGTREFVTLELTTDEGVEGIGITFFGAALTLALKSAVDSLAELVIGEDPMRVEAIVAKLRRAASGAGPGGIFTLALAAVDLALWDIKGKALGQTLNAMAGGARDRVDTYASGALMRPHPLDYLRDAGPRLVEMGFKQMKTQLGAEKSVTESIERIRTLREAIGEDIDLMCDINQLWNVNQAIEVGTRILDYHLFLARRRRRVRRLPRPGPRRRRPDNPHRHRRVRLRHRAPQASDREPQRRHRDDRPVARRRSHPVAQGCGHGRGLRSAGCQPPHPGGAVPSRQCDPARPHGRVHAVVHATLGRDA